MFACPFSPDGKFLASGNQDRGVNIWCLDTLDCVHTMGADGVKRVLFSPDGTLVMSGIGDYSAVELWNVETGEYQDLEGHKDDLVDYHFSHDGKMIVSASHSDCRVWCVETGDCLHVLEGHEWISACCFSPDGTLVASGDDAVRIWRVDTGECIQVLQGHSDTVLACCFSPDGKLIVSCGDDDPDLRVWRVDTGECIHVIEHDYERVVGFEFSPDGELVAFRSEDVMLWRLATGEILHDSLGLGTTRTCTFSPDGALLAAGHGTKLCVYRVDTGECLYCFSHPDGDQEYISDCHFSPDGRVLASSSLGTNGQVCLWGPFV